MAPSPSAAQAELPRRHRTSAVLHTLGQFGSGAMMAAMAGVVVGCTPVASAEISTRPQRFEIYLTGYSYWDNTPPGSSAISKPVVHLRAGGTGTYADPVTIAVGHSIVGGRQTLDFPAGTRFYLPRLQKYAIVEDVCGDGARPQDGPCHTGYRGRPWLDIYVDGARSSAATADACARRITGLQTIVMNPEPGLPVHAGPLTESGCSIQ